MVTNSGGAISATSAPASITFVKFSGAERRHHLLSCQEDNTACNLYTHVSVYMYMALHLSIPISNTSMTQQGVVSYVIELSSKSFEVRSQSGPAFAQGRSC